jgi:hypothetical protein
LPRAIDGWNLIGLFMEINSMTVRELFDAGALNTTSAAPGHLLIRHLLRTLLELVAFSPMPGPPARHLGKDDGAGPPAICRRPEVRFYIRDYAREDLPGTYLLIVSPLWIHHLEDSGKQMLMRKIFSA